MSSGDRRELALARSSGDLLRGNATLWNRYIRGRQNLRRSSQDLENFRRVRAVGLNVIVRTIPLEDASGTTCFTIGLIRAARRDFAIEFYFFRTI